MMWFIASRHCFSIASRLLSSGPLFSWHKLPPLINAESVKSLLIDGNKFKFIDVRSPEQYSKGHIPDAVNIHEVFTYLFLSGHDNLGEERLRIKFENLFQKAGINGNEPVIVYENSLKTMYGVSCRGFYLLKLLGHPSVSILNGGFEAWTKQGLPNSTATPSVSQGTFRACWVNSMWSNKHDVQVAIKEKNTTLLDVRDADEWEGRSSSPYGVDFVPRKGRLPGAIHIHWHDFMKTGKDGMTYFREPEEVREMCAAKGLMPDNKMIVYCFKGARASNTYIALKEAGFTNVSNYFGSWNEWSRDHQLEIDSKIL